MKLNKFAKVLAGTILLTGVLAPAWADDKTMDPSGTYVWTTPGRNGGPDRTNTLVLKLAGDKLTGDLTLPGRGGQVNNTDITDGKITGADVLVLRGAHIQRQHDDEQIFRHDCGRYHQGQNRIHTERRSPQPRLGSEKTVSNEVTRPEGGDFAGFRRLSR